jgi:hypothetical protein
MKKIIIIIVIIVLILIIIFVHDRKSINEGFTGTIYTINYCDERDHCDEMITIGKKIPNSIKQYKSRDAALKDFNNKKMYYKHIIKKSNADSNNTVSVDFYLLITKFYLR